jgi:thymidylate synthase (FAD)
MIFVPQHAILEYITTNPELTIVNSARVSHGKYKTELDNSDIKLIDFLYKHQHWSPFRHVNLKFNLKMPLCVRSQFIKHRLGFVYGEILGDDLPDFEINEVSRRYVKGNLEFYQPVWRKADENVKQGSGSEFTDSDVKYCEFQKLNLKLSGSIKNEFEYQIRTSINSYNKLLELGVAPEQARMVLPQNLMTQCVVTCSFQAFVNLMQLRLKPNAQKEIQELCKMMYNEVQAQLTGSCLLGILESSING